MVGGAPGCCLAGESAHRDTAAQKLGSLAYNIEVRLAYGLATWDVNGTPKAFPRRFDDLLNLASDDGSTT